MAESKQKIERIEVDFDVLLGALDSLRLAPVYALLHVAPEEIAEDFKPHKWEGYEREFAAGAVETYKKLLREMTRAVTEKQKED